MIGYICKLYWVCGSNGCWVFGFANGLGLDPNG